MSSETGSNPNISAQAWPVSAYQRDVLGLAFRLAPDPVAQQTYSFRMDEPLDIARLQACWRRALMSDESLRLRFAFEDGEFRQWVSDEISEVEVIDLTAEADPEGAAQDWLWREVAAPERPGRLAGLAAVVDRPDRFFLFISVHHALADGYGMNPLIATIDGAYKRKDVPLDVLAVPESANEHTDRSAATYRQIAEDDRQYRESEQYTRDRAALLTAMDGFEPALFTGRSAKPKVVRGHYDTVISGSYVDRIRATGFTVYAYTAAAVAVYLATLHRTDEVVIGCPMLNRHSAETYRTAGHRANTIPLRVLVDRSVPLTEVAAGVTQQIRALKKRQRVPYGELIRALNPDPAAPPLYDVAYSFTKLPDADYVHELFEKWTVLNPGTVLDALTIVVAENGRDGSLNLQLFYDKDVFDANFPIEGALRSVREMVTAALENPQTPVGALPLLSERAAAEVAAFEAGPRTEFPYTTIDRLFNNQAAEHPDRVALVPAAGSGWHALTYAELSGRVDGFAAWLHELGATGNECVPVVLHRSTDMLIAILGILRAGCAYVPLDPDYPAARIETVLADCAARFVVAGPEHTQVYAMLGVARVSVADTVPGTVENVSHPADLSYLIYTSGSTGVPKGVMIEHRSVVNRLLWMQRRYPLAADDVILQKTPVTFDVSVWELFWWAITGARVALLEVGGERDPRRIAAAIEAEAVTVLHFVPAMLAAFVDELVADRTIVPRIVTLRRVFCSGEALPPALVRRFHAAFAAVRQPPPQLVNLYGPTEATVDVSYFDCLPDDAIALVPIGRPIDNIDLLVLDESGRRLPIGVPGELNIAGIGVARGYRGRPDLTAAAFVDDRGVPGRRRYRTGDLARWLPNGSLEYLGRFDDQVKIRGNRITLGEVRNAILGCRGVRDAAVVDEQSDAHGPHLVGYFVGDGIGGDEIADRIADRLPRYMIPVLLVAVDRIPLTANGKTDRKALAERAAEQTGTARAAHAEPRTPLEGELLQVWRTVLGVDAIGVHDNFFTNGGDSILALSVRTAAERAGLYFDVDAFYRHPTIAELAGVVSDGPDRNRIRITEALETIPLIDRAALAQAEDAFPATALQLGMLFHSVERTDSVTYKDVFRYRLDMPWDDAHFRAAFDRLVRRQPALRSSFELSRFSVPLHIVHTAADYELGIVDLTDSDPEHADRQVEAYTQERRHAQYDLSTAPLHAARAFLRPGAGDRRTVDLVLSFHHAILDGWSVATSVLELLLDYLHRLGVIESGIDGTPHSASVLAEYAQAELSALHDNTARDYWRTALAGAEPTALTALGVHQPGAGAEPQARALVPRQLAERVTAFAARNQVPEKAVYLAAHCLTLRTVTGRTDITTGMVSHGRPDRAGAERVAGLFLNTLPMRLDDRAATWRAAVDQIARREQEAYPHRRYPLRAILADGGPAFETAFNYINYHIFAPIVGADSVRLSDFDVREDTNFQLLVTVANDPRDGRIWVRVNGDHTLTKNQCETVAITQLRMLASIVADPDAAIDRGTGAATARDVGTLVAEAAALNPDATALQGDEFAVTYGELVEWCDLLVQRLSGFGVRTGDRIGILMRRRPELVLLVLALTRIGAACVPLDVSYPRARLNRMIERADPHRVITDADYAEVVDDAALLLDTAALFGAPATTETARYAVAPRVSPDAVAYVLFTSGSTGEPKGVAMPHRGLTAMVDWQNRSASGVGLASTLQLAPLSFDVSFQEIFSTLAAGSTLRVSSADLRSNVGELLNTVVDEGIERLFLPYVALQAFAESVVSRRVFPTDLKVLASSGEQLRITDEIRALCKVVPGLLLENQYGPTESHVATTFTLTGPADDYPPLPPIGRAVDGDTVELLDGALRPVADGVIGEIYLGGRSIARGYQGRAALTAQRFVATHRGGIRYRTGDLGVRLASGDIVCLGRSDSQIKVRGYRVEPAEVELCILGLVDKYQAITEAAVVARGFGGIDGVLIAFLAAAAGQVDLAALRHDLRAVLPAHMVPSRFVFLDELPRTPSGKRDDGALRSLVEAAPESAAAPREPIDEYERSAMALLAEYAGLRSIGLDDDFFASGGTSVGAMRVVMGLSRRWGVDIALDSFIGGPTAAELAALIRSGNTQRIFDPLVPLSVGGSKPPLFLVHPIGGNVLCYLALSRYLDPDRAVYGLQAAGADPGSTPEKTIEAMAASYLDAVRRVRPDGPYHLAGWSFGGNVALEMARQLPEHEVASVTLLDTMALRRRAREPIGEEQLIRWFFLELLWYARGEQAALDDFEPDVHGCEQLFDAMLAEAIRSAILPADSSPQAIRRLYDVFHANYTALLEYRLEPYDRDFTLLRAEDGLPPGVDIAHKTVGSMFDSENNGWEQYAARDFTLVAVPGDHLHMMTEPHVGVVAARLDAALAAADPGLDREFGEAMLEA